MVFAAVFAERKYNVQRFNLVYSALYSCSLFKKYGGWRRISPRMLLLCSIGTFFLILCFSEITLWYGMRIDSQTLRAISGYYGNLNSPLVLLCSVITLLYVLSRKEFSCTIINKVSEACFGVYLIHDNPHLRTWLWGFFLKEKEHLTPIGLAKYGACVVLLIFCVCCVIDWTRSFLFANVMKCLVHRTSFEKVNNVEEGDTIEK